MASQTQAGSIGKAVAGQVAGAINFRWVRSAHRVRARLVYLAVGLCLLVLVGYALGADRMFQPQRISGGTHPLTFLAATCIAAGLAGYRPLRSTHPGDTALPLLALAIALARITEALVAHPQMPFSDLFLPALYSDGLGTQMGLNTAATVLFLSLGILLRRSHPALGFALAGAAPFVPILSIFGYLYGQSGFHGAMSPISSGIFLALSIAGLSCYAHQRNVRVLLRGDAFGFLARAQILAIVVFFGAGGAILTRVGPGEAHPYVAIFVTVTIWFLTAMVVLASQAYESADIRRRTVERRLAVESMTDPLTGLTNRRAAESVGRMLFEQSSRTGESLAVLLIDLDRFKRVNDRFGHPEGDAVLRRMARVLEGRLRKSDIVTRWGGEEFMVILPGAGAPEARTVAEELRQRVAAQLTAGHGAEKMNVTASIGFAARAEADDDLAQMVARADAALYAAKHNGRNRVAACPSPEEETPAIVAPGSVFAMGHA
jgi:diguanylate cyclase (GGDEF)-like protein